MLGPVTFPTNSGSFIYYTESVIPAEIVIEGTMTISPINS